MFWKYYRVTLRVNLNIKKPLHYQCKRFIDTLNQTVQFAKCLKLNCTNSALIVRARCAHGWEPWLYGKTADKLKQTWDRQKAVLGKKHPDTLSSMANLALIWKAKDRNAEAVKLMQECALLHYALASFQRPYG